MSNEQLQRDIALVQATIAWGAESPAALEAWQRIRARLTPDRERVARAIDTATRRKLSTQEVFEAVAAAIAAMEGK